MQHGKQNKKAYIEGEIYNHRLLWLTVMFLHDLAQVDEEGSHHPLLAAQLFAYLAFEGYLNYLGALVAPDVWQNERDFFSSGQYRGTLGKLDFLLTALDVAAPKGARPYQTLTLLDMRRDAVVHPRLEEVSVVFRHHDPTRLPTHKEPDLFSYSDEAFVERAVQDVEDVADRLQVAAQVRLGEHVVRSPRAFRGILWSQGGHVMED